MGYSVPYTGNKNKKKTIRNKVSEETRLVRQVRKAVRRDVYEEVLLKNWAEGHGVSSFSRKQVADALNVTDNQLQGLIKYGRLPEDDRQKRFTATPLMLALQALLSDQQAVTL